jgi:hypothetical protein
LRRPVDEAGLAVVWAPSTRRTSPEVEAIIDLAWRNTQARPGVKLFDGGVCRFESCVPAGSGLVLSVSQTSYRIVVGTNFCNPQLASTHGPEFLANPLGVSAALRSRDGRLVLGRRNHSVAYYPDMLHPFAGSVEVRPRINLFDDVRRELDEEIGLGPQDISSIRFVGIAQDLTLLHPEAIFVVDSTCDAREILARVRNDEHSHARVIDAGGDLREITPIGLAAIDACRG